MQRPFVHPAIENVTLEGILYALADPVRLEIIRRIAKQGCGMNCQAAAPPSMARSTQSHHYQILREAGLIHSERKGVEVVNTLRCGEIDQKFPGLIPSILAAAAKGDEKAGEAR